MNQAFWIRPNPFVSLYGLVTRILKSSSLLLRSLKTRKPLISPQLVQVMEMGQETELPVSQVEASDLNQSSSYHVAQVKKLLFRRMLVGIQDGRFFLGSFHCIDKQGNIILQDAVEYRNTRRFAASPMEQRCLGLILIPSSCRTSCHVDCSIEEQLSLLKLQQ